MIDLPLPQLVAALQSDQQGLGRLLDELERRFATREPLLHAFLPEPDRFTRLRREAEELLRQFPRPEFRPPLFGVPVGVKDIFHVAGFTTRAGSRLPADLLQGSEAESVAQLKQAGALILGKTVTTEFAYFAPGPTRNPHHPQHTPGGSSSGSAAAVGAGLCPLALGTQTIGSIMRPASYCGVVGFKPTFGRISRAGVIPLAPSFDHVGFFTRDVPGASLTASLLCADWQAHTAIAAKPVLAIPEGPYLACASSEMLDHFHGVCGRLVDADYEVKTVDAMPDFESIRTRHSLITNAEAARVHREWFPRMRDAYHPKTAEKLELGRTVSEAALAQALLERDAFNASMSALMRQHAIDLWLSPAAPGPAPAGLESTGDPEMNLPWTQLGFPVVTLPAGRNSSGLPLGVQLSGQRKQDERLLHWAAELETIVSPRG